jgi:protein-S-isoprenylcysteine O-methyltransferase Ste14
MLYRRSTWLTILVVDVALFVVAAIVGQHPKQHWKDVLGGIGWFGFLICTLALIVIALAWLLHGRRRSVTSTRISAAHRSDS